MKIILGIATVIDFGLAALLIGVSGFMFGGGPESMHAGTLAAAGYIAIVIGCIAAPIVGFILNARGKAGLALAVGFLPPVAGAVALMIPPPY